MARPGAHRRRLRQAARRRASEVERRAARGEQGSAGASRGCHGRVAFADWLAGLGLLIIVDHGDGYMSLYGHNEALLKEPGDWVEPGEPIAQVGDTRRAVAARACTSRSAKRRAREPAPVDRAQGALTLRSRDIKSRGFPGQHGAVLRFGGIRGG